MARITDCETVCDSISHFLLPLPTFSPRFVFLFFSASVDRALLARLFQRDTRKPQRKIKARPFRPKSLDLPRFRSSSHPVHQKKKKKKNISSIFFELQVKYTFFPSPTIAYKKMKMKKKCQIVSEWEAR
ncbi:hypothetical protein CDAR_70651 [Caerostris darwini]|uniref:Uncharacterized protein n=1 Tax=Caerostris darwini TaxID=1538125 RepID=A0AAV4WH64_9ARAC|nr:hypothetical protein CDAR_70651 [Caerostris darwini]